MTTTREAALEAALKSMLHSVCGPTGFAEAVRHNSGLAYPWHSLDAAEAQACAALSTPATEPQGVAHIVDYTNWRGETARRVIRPIRMWWGKTEWHPEEQWMLTAWDCEKDAIRDFAWQDMRPVQNPATSAAALAARPESPDTPPASDYVAALEAAANAAWLAGPSQDLAQEELSDIGKERRDMAMRCEKAIRALITDRDRDALSAHVAAEVAKARAELYAQIEAMPRREELLGGQRTQYVQLHEVLAWIGAKP